MELVRGQIEGAQKICLYGVEGIGKSYFASKFPRPIFIDTEGSTKHMNVVRTPAPSSWTMLINQVQEIKNKHSNDLDTLVIDTIDWAEQLCISHICNKSKKDGIEDWGYGKGYVYLAEEMGRFLNALGELVDLGINIVLVAHAQMRKFEQPDEMGAYDRWEMKLQKKTAPMVKEWADMVLFANYKTYVINVDGQGADKGTNKVQGGKRVMYTTHHPCWDAKNRHDLLPELPFDYDEIGPLIITRGSKQLTAPSTTKTEPPNPPVTPPQTIEQEFEQMVTTGPQEPSSQPTQPPIDKDIYSDIPKALADLMKQNNVIPSEVQQAVASRGYYPEDTPIKNYDEGFIQGCLIGAWTQMLKVIEEIKQNETPL